MNSFPTRRAVLALVPLLMLGGPAAWSDAEEGINFSSLPAAHIAFERLKRLEGSWAEAEYGRIVQYHLTGEGSALIEEFIGDPPMTTVYHLDGEDLRLTHYCNAGNQPRMVSSFYRNDVLRFSFVDVTNLKAPDAYHTRELEVTFRDRDNVVLVFTGRKEGAEVVTTHTLTRRTN